MHFPRLSRIMSRTETYGTVEFDLRGLYCNDLRSFGLDRESVFHNNFPHAILFELSDNSTNADSIRRED